MKLSTALFDEVVQRLAQAGGATIGLAEPEVAHWLESLDELPRAFVDFLKHHSPKNEIWAGAGFIFGEAVIMRRNKEFPRALQAGLFILGSAPNGDLIVVDVREPSGAVGYLMHERMYSADDLRSLFAPVSESIGEFLYRINDHDSNLPDDYFQATAVRRQQDGEQQ
jgi:hypothetical protein